jgi:hypothetical protein
LPRRYTPRNASRLTPKTSPKPESSYPELKLKQDLRILMTLHFLRQNPDSFLIIL